LKRGLAFLSGGGPRQSSYGTRLSRLRWARAAGVDGDAIADWAPGDPAATTLGAADHWVFVPDSASLPVGPPGQAVHTLRELETAPGGDLGTAMAAIAFQPADLPPSGDETIEQYCRRLLTVAGAFRPLPSFSVADFSGSERPEIVERLPEGTASILDAGCGSGGLGLARSRRPGWRLTGVERDPVRAARARQSEAYERLIEADLAAALPELAAAGDRFDAFVFADVLEHLEDPVASLRAALAIAREGARLVAVVPNVGHLSVVRDLLLGRHDPVPAGLCDAGHLRWFSKAFLAETIEEAGWRLERIEGLAGAPPPDPEPFLALARSWPDADLGSLATYQWIATASKTGGAP
jgi:SAM-dependent methyltransferase